MATTVERTGTIRKGQEPLPALHELPCKGTTKCLAGTIGVTNAGYVQGGAAATTLKTWGRIEETVDNTSGGDGALKVKILSGEFWWKNSLSTDEITQADVGADCYVVDNETVAKTDGTASRSKAGKIIEVDSAKGVLVAMGPAFF